MPSRAVSHKNGEEDDVYEQTAMDILERDVLSLHRSGFGYVALSLWPGCTHMSSSASSSASSSGKRGSGKRGSSLVSPPQEEEEEEGDAPMLDITFQYQPATKEYPEQQWVAVICYHSPTAAIAPPDSEASIAAHASMRTLYDLVYDLLMGTQQPFEQERNSASSSSSSSSSSTSSRNNNNKGPKKESPVNQQQQQQSRGKWSAATQPPEGRTWYHSDTRSALRFGSKRQCACALLHVLLRFNLEVKLYLRGCFYPVDDPYTTDLEGAAIIRTKVVGILAALRCMDVFMPCLDVIIEGDVRRQPRTLAMAALFWHDNVICLRATRGRCLSPLSIDRITGAASSSSSASSSSHTRHVPLATAVVTRTFSKSISSSY
jgi:hypothetical protein